MPEDTQTSSIDYSKLAIKAITTVMIGIVVFLLIWLGSFAAFQAWHAGRILPHIMAGTLDLGGLTPEEAGVKLYTQFTFSQNNKSRLILPDGSQETDLSALGIRLDAAATTMRAYQQGRNLLDGQWIALMFNLDPKGYQVKPQIIFDQQAAYDYLLQISRQVDQPAVEASLLLDGTRVIASPGSTGFVVDIPATIDLISQQILEGNLDQVTLVVEVVEPDLMDASPFTSIAEKVLSRSFLLRIPDSQADAGKTWEISPDELAPMLTFPKEIVNGSTTIKPRLHEMALTNLLARVSAESGIASENPRFIFNDDTRQLDLLTNAITGRQLNIEKSARAVQEAVSAGNHESGLVFNLIQPEVTDSATASALGITELVHEESSYFFGSSSARIHNIEIAASEFYGLLVAPGETFSMASAMGDVSLDAGYTEALIIFDGRTIEGVGGGVCQVSTTLFRAAFFAGFPIVERHPHAYRVSYYEKTAGNQRDPNLAGLDATVYVPIVDLKFTNDTPYWLLMETYINRSASRITWKFYSTSDNRSVQWHTTGPTNIVEPKKPKYTLNPKLEPGEIKQVDWEAQGADVRVNRSVYRDGSLILEDSFFTQYAPWRAVYEYGHGVDGIPTSNEED